MTQEELKIFSPNTPDQLIPIVTDWFNKYCDQFEVNTPPRITAFFAELILESNAFKATREYASGSEYEGREDLGNIYPGDGKKYKGRGYIQITGRNNYAAVSKYIFKDDTFVKNPDLLATPQYAMLSAFWFWDTRNLNKYADYPADQKVTTNHHGVITPFEFITLEINGGFNDLSARIENYNRICDYYKLPHCIKTL